MALVDNSSKRQLPPLFSPHGSPEAIFGPSRSSWLLLFVFGSIVVVVGLVALVAAFFVPEQRGFLFGVGGGGLAIGALFLLIGWLQKQLGYFIFEDGLGRVAEGRAKFTRWDDFATFRRVVVPNQTRHFFTLKDGSSFNFGSGEIVDANELWRQIESKVLPCLKRDAERALANGETIDFHYFRADSFGLHCRNAVGVGFRLIPWGDIRGQAIEEPKGVGQGDAFLVLGDSHEVLGAAPAGMIPNIQLLAGLIQQKIGKP